MMRRLNRAAGILVTVLLLWVMYRQLRGHLQSTDGHPWYYIRSPRFMWAAAALLPFNIGIEAVKWQMLLRGTAPVSFFTALKSVLAGIAFSMITPNRLGEYPGRIAMLERRTSPRVISVAVLGAVSQFLTVMLAGAGGLLYALPLIKAWWVLPLLCAAIPVAIAAAVFYFSFERWAPRVARLPFLKKWSRLGTVLRRFSRQELWMVLFFAMLRFAVFTTQYYLVLRSVGLHYPTAGAWVLCALFFFILAMVPSIVLAEAGIRGEVGLFLFGAFVPDKLSLVVATLALWIGNMVVPALLGSLLFLKKRWRR